MTKRKSHPVKRRYQKRIGCSWRIYINRYDKLSASGLISKNIGKMKVIVGEKDDDGE